MHDAEQANRATTSAQPWSIGTALATVYFARYCSFEGRAGRKEFWYAVLPTLAGIAVYVSILLGSMASLIFELLLLAAIGVVLLPLTALLVRRLHDMGLSGWYALLLLAPWVGSPFILGCCLFPSEGANKWGRTSDGPAEG